MDGDNADWRYLKSRELSHRCHLKEWCDGRVFLKTGIFTNSDKRKRVKMKDNQKPKRVKRKMPNDYWKRQRLKKKKESTTCPYCKISLIITDGYKRCPQCEYYKKSVPSKTKLPETQRQRMARLFSEQQAIYDKLKREFERDSKESPKLQ